MERSSYWEDAIIAAIVAITPTISLIWGSVIYSSKKIPATSKVQQGYVIPNRLENRLEKKLQNLYGNEQKGVLMYHEKNYLFTLDAQGIDAQGIPKVQAYEIKPAEIVPKQK